MKNPTKEPDYLLLSGIAVLVVFGLVMLSSAGSATGFKHFGDSYFFLKYQLTRGIIPGIILAYIASRIPYDYWRRLALPFLGLSLFLLVLVFVPGIGTDYGTRSQSWINFFGVFSLQPSEVVKFTFLIYLAAWFSSLGEKVKTMEYGLVPFLGLLAAVGGLIVLQPDIGTLLVIVMIAGSVFWTAGARVSHYLGLILLGVLVIVIMVKMAPYRMDRFTAFLDSEKDPQGIGYHTRQAFIAVGSGGLWGRGFGQSRQKFEYLPEVTGDSIFAIIVEEEGALVCGMYLLLLLFVGYRGYKIAMNAPDEFSRLLSTGIVSWLLFQSFVNIGAMVGLLPITGLPLPFISYGGTALMINLVAVGVLVNISKKVY